jgi:hypothetical protein
MSSIFLPRAMRTSRPPTEGVSVSGQSRRSALVRYGGKADVTAQGNDAVCQEQTSVAAARSCRSSAATARASYRRTLLKTCTVLTFWKLYDQNNT